MFRSARRRACDERAFVLLAVGIPGEVEFAGEGYVVLVEGALREQALRQLALYEEDRARRPPVAMDAPAPQAGGWRGAAGYAAVLLLVPFAVGQGWLGADPYGIGALDPQSVRAGQWWRALTALTLHWDATHLFGNLAAGALLGISAAQVWGSARAWLLIAVAGMSANLAEGLLDIGHYVSAGASTAVFAALGLVAAHAWRTRGKRSRALRDWVPLVAGLALLGMFGAGVQDPDSPAGGETTDVVAHALGFTAGALLGAAAATSRGARWIAAIPAWLAAVMTPAVVLAAWLLALYCAP
ncbi:MAG TPA: rhomboid family intramembrane serine protease [Steroidobacteraceae bacterium]|nr:rhomboid family intramembrane serine protease [Steroidobacteraceae bacterium]